MAWYYVCLLAELAERDAERVPDAEKKPAAVTTKVYVAAPEVTTSKIKLSVQANTDKKPTVATGNVAVSKAVESTLLRFLADIL